MRAFRYLTPSTQASKSAPAWIALACSLVLTLLPVPVRAELFSARGLELKGDFRLRLESDFDSRQADGEPRADRDRLRYRLRFAAEYTLDKHWTLGLRLRSGSRLSHQSPHVTFHDFDGGDAGDLEFRFDKAFVQWQGDDHRVWIGRNAPPLWYQNELFWDEDVTTAGVGWTYSHPAGRLKLNAGHFALPVGMTEWSGRLTLMQGVYEREDLFLAAGFWHIEADPDDPDAALLLRGNGFRDYSVAVLGYQRTWCKLSVGLDLAHNFERQHGPLEDEVNALVATFSYGSSKEAGQSSWRYTFAHVEALALSSSYAQDDWVRWGTATQTRATDIEGHELRWTYGLRGGHDLMLRYYRVQSIVTDEDGHRLRLDFNYRF